MSTWIQLSADKVHSLYAVPIEIAMADGYSFFGLEHHPFDLDGPRPLLAFLRDKAQSNAVTLNIFSILPEALEYEGFNPLTETGGSLTLGRQELTGLISLLRKYSRRLPSTDRSDRKMFEEMEDSTVADFHLHPEWFPRSRRFHYYQLYNPLSKSEEDPTVTILLLSSGHTGSLQAPLSLHIKIMSFPLQELQDQSFNPLDDSLARIHLDRNGLQELASLLEAGLDHLAR